LEWIEHKAPPVPILAGSEILFDSLYVYGVDFMSTDDVKRYFKKYLELSTTTEDQVRWINDSSCVVKFPSSDLAKLAYFELKLSEPREDEKLPPLNLYLQDLREMEKREKERKLQNPDYDTLFEG
jgi:hypothetical protein